MSVIVGLKEISLLDCVGDLGLFLLKQSGIKNILIRVKYDIEILNSLENSSLLALISQALTAIKYS